jgi:hypothetical protein
MSTLKKYGKLEQKCRYEIIVTRLEKLNYPLRRGALEFRYVILLNRFRVSSILVVVLF